VVMHVGDCNRIGCFSDQMKLTRTLVRDLDEAIKEVKLLGEHEEESSQNGQEVEGRCSKAVGGEDQARGNGQVSGRAHYGDRKGD
jgi:hypothetical protein